MTVVERRATDRGRLLISPLEVFATFLRHRKLIQRLAWREIEARYRGSTLGLAWSVAVPLVLLAVYTAVFSTIFKSRWELTTERATPFPLVLFIGLIFFNFLAEVINRASGLMLENVTYIKKIVFPLDALPWVTVVVALFNAGVSSLAFLVGYLVFVGVPPATALLAPLMLLPLLLLAAGGGWFLSALGIYIRDFQQFVPIVVTVLMYVNPVFYPRNLLVKNGYEVLATIMQFSPIAVSIEEARQVLFAGQQPNWPIWAAHLLIAWALAWGGLVWFNKTRKGFADVV